MSSVENTSCRFEMFHVSWATNTASILGGISDNKGRLASFFLASVYRHLLPCQVDPSLKSREGVPNSRLSAIAGPAHYSQIRISCDSLSHPFPMDLWLVVQPPGSETNPKVTEVGCLLLASQGPIGGWESDIRQWGAGSPECCPLGSLTLHASDKAGSV